MATAVQAAPTFELIAIAQIAESPLNTRKHFDAVKLEELRASIEQIGIRTPLLVRPRPNGFYEIAGGHRRFRAAQMAGLEEVPCLVEELDDATFLEILSIDNLQREDVHPLEEAQGYKNLLTLDGYDVPKIAKRVGKSESYVYDRLKLLQLTKTAQKLFLNNGFSAGHAILIARLDKATQERLVNPDNGDLWQGDHGHDPLGIQDDLGIEHPQHGERSKPISVRSLQMWIDDHVRFTAPDPSLPHLFPETAANLAQATVEKAKVVEISRDHLLKDDAKHPDGKRTYCTTSWKRADGQVEAEDWWDDKQLAKAPPSPTCEHSVLGLVVAGRGRGESFQVCIDKKRCTIHWGEEIKARNKRERDRERAANSGTLPDFGGGKVASKKELTNVDRVQQAINDAKGAAEHAAREKARPAILTAIAAALKKAPADSTGPLGKYLWEMGFENGVYGVTDKSKEVEKYISRGSTAADFMRHAALCILVAGWDDNDEDTLLADLKQLKLKVDVEKVVAPMVQAAIAAVEKKFAKDLETAREEDKDDAAKKTAAKKKAGKK
jgi:ParB/RepB/Spo0J family partition protein